MKELSIEEKAKRYDDLLVKLQEAKVDNNVCDERYCCVIDNIVPELKESEDERIRKWLIGYFNQYIIDGMPQVFGNGLNVKDVISWLEKQGEQKPIVKTQMVYPKFRIGDVISPNVEDGKGDYTIVGFNKALADYLVDGGNIPSCSIGIEFIDDNFHIKKQKPVEWSEEDEENLKWFEKFFRAESVIAEGKDIPQDRYLWLKSLKGRVQPQPKQEWNGGDEAHLHSLITHLEQWIERHPNTTGADIQGENITWLKSLRPQIQWKAVDKEIYVKEPALAQRKDKSEPNHGYVICYDHTLTHDVYERFIMISDIYNQSHWKPSDEQMEALEHFVRSIGESGYASPYDNNTKVLYSLLSDLKKLKG